MELILRIHNYIYHILALLVKVTNAMGNPLYIYLRATQVYTCTFEFAFLTEVKVTAVIYSCLLKHTLA